MTMSGGGGLDSVLTLDQRKVGVMMPRPLTTLHVGGCITGDCLTVNGPLTVNGSVTVTGNIQTATLGVTGGSTFFGRAAFTGGDGQVVGTSTSGLGALEVQSSPGTGAAKISFHRPGYYAAYFGLDTDNVWKVGGWSAGAVAYPIILGNVSNNASITVTGGITASGNITSASYLYANSNVLYFAAGTSFVTWNGSQIGTSHNLMVGGAIVFLANNGGIWMQWHGSGFIFFSHSVLTQGSGYYFNNNGGQSITNDNTWFRMTHSMSLPSSNNQLNWASNGSYISGNAGYVQGSKRALKRAIEPIPDSRLLSLVADQRMPVSSFRWNEPDNAHGIGNRRNVGFMADDVAVVLPDAVTRDESGSPAGYNAQELTAILWGAVRSLSARVEALEA